MLREERNRAAAAAEAANKNAADLQATFAQLQSDHTSLLESVTNLQAEIERLTALAASKNEETSSALAERDQALAKVAEINGAKSHLPTGGIVVDWEATSRDILRLIESNNTKPQQVLAESISGYFKTKISG